MTRLSNWNRSVKRHALSFTSPQRLAFTVVDLNGLPVDCFGYDQAVLVELTKRPAELTKYIEKLESVTEGLRHRLRRMEVMLEANRAFTERGLAGFYDVLKEHNVSNLAWIEERAGEMLETRAEAVHNRVMEDVRRHSGAL